MLPVSAKNPRNRQSQPLVATSGSGQNICHLFYVTDCSTEFIFLVVTGAQVSAIQPTPVQRKHPQEGLCLQAVNNSTIATYGNQLLMLDLDCFVGFL